jgi:hypothetical protein
MQQALGKYQLGEMLGHGGMGAVYKSFHPLLNRPVAVKLMLASVAADPQAHQRFLREAQIVAALSHPHIVNIFDVDIQNGQPYLVMDFVEGGSLAGRLRAGPLALAEALRLAFPLAEALAYAHLQGVLHRDLKPANVLLRGDGSPVLADFGLARPSQVDSAAKLTATGAVMGTLAYMAPEQFGGGPADARADIYSFGVMLYEMLTGRVPFEGDSAQIMYGHLQQPPPAPRQLNPTLPESAERLLLGMLSKDPAWRPQSMDQVVAALRSILSGDDAAIGATIPIETAATLTAPTGLGSVTLPFPRRWLVPLLLAVPAAAAVCGLLLLLPLLSRRAQPTAEPTARPAIPIAAPSAQPATSTAGEADAAPLPTGPGEAEPTPAPPTRVDQPLAKLEQSGPEPFSAGGITYRKDRTLWFFGEVRNDGDEAREAIQVRVNLLDMNGKEIASKAGFASMSYLKPGEVSPFSVLFDEGETPAEFAEYRIEVSSSKGDFQIGYAYRDLSVTGEPQSRRDEYGFVEIKGRVRNGGQAPAKFVQIFAVFYDDAGNVVGIANTFAETSNDAPLAPGAEARFEIEGVVFSGPATRYRLFAEGSNAS